MFCLNSYQKFFIASLCLSFFALVKADSLSEIINKVTTFLDQVSSEFKAEVGLKVRQPDEDIIHKYDEDAVPVRSILKNKSDKVIQPAPRPNVDDMPPKYDPKATPERSILDATSYERVVPQKVVPQAPNLETSVLKDADVLSSQFFRAPRQDVDDNSTGWNRALFARPRHSILKDRPSKVVPPIFEEKIIPGPMRSSSLNQIALGSREQLKLNGSYKVPLNGDELRVDKTIHLTKNVNQSSDPNYTLACGLAALANLAVGFDSSVPSLITKVITPYLEMTRNQLRLEAGINALTSKNGQLVLKNGNLDEEELLALGKLIAINNNQFKKVFNNKVLDRATPYLNHYLADGFFFIAAQDKPGARSVIEGSQKLDRARDWLESGNVLSTIVLSDGHYVNIRYQKQFEDKKSFYVAQVWETVAGADGRRLLEGEQNYARAISAFNQIMFGRAYPLEPNKR